MSLSHRFPPPNRSPENPAPGTLYAAYLRLLPQPPQGAHCVVCRGPWAGDAYCERCKAPMDFDCHQERVITPTEREAFHAMLAELNAPGPLLRVEGRWPDGSPFRVTVRAEHRPADDLWLIVLCPGCRS